LYLPIWALRYFLSTLTSRVESVTLWRGALSLFRIGHVAVYVPLASLLIIRTVVPRFAENIFFAVLRAREPTCANQIQTYPINVWKWCCRFVWRLIKVLTFSGMLGLVSLFPYVGPLAVVLAEFFLFQRMMGMWAAVTFSVVAVVLKKFSLFSVLKYFLASRSLSLELLSPYLERVSSNENSKDLFVHRLRQSQRQKHRYSGLLLGFGVFWLVLLSQPLVGPLFWGLAQGSAAVLLLEILQVERDARTHVNISASAYTS
jgi:hypothetical protein